VSKVQRMFGINYNQARTWIDWLIENGHAEPFDDRPWEVRLI
jgi:transposase-like protein